MMGIRPVGNPSSVPGPIGERPFLFSVVLQYPIGLLPVYPGDPLDEGIRDNVIYIVPSLIAEAALAVFGGPSSDAIIPGDETI